MLSKSDDLSVINSFGGGEEFIKFLGTNDSFEHPDIVILDLKMKPKDGIETADHINKYFSHIKIIILSTHYSQSFAGYIFKLGVSAFLPKTIDYEELNTAIKTVHCSHIYLTPNDNKSILEHLRNPQTPKSMFDNSESLSSREKEILLLICQQKTNSEIAEILFLSKRTIDGHRMRLIEKTGARNTAGLVVYAILNGILEIEEYMIKQSFIS